MWKRGRELERILHLVTVEAAARLAAQPACVHHANEERTGAVFWVSETLVQDTEDIDTDVEADEVRQCQWAHGMGHAQLKDLIDSFGCGYALHDGEGGFVDQRHQ